MNHKLLTICALAALTTGLTGCNEAVDNGLDCSDGQYRAQCVDSKYMMYCDTTTNTEAVKACEGGYVCADVNGVADCIDPNASKTDPKPSTCTNGTTQCNGYYVQTCVNNAWQNAATACEYGCENGVCKAAPIVSDCSIEGAKQCNADNSKVQTCTNGSWVDDADACEYGCENGACKDAPVLDCTEEGATQCNEDNSNVQTCVDGHWVDDFPACNFGCEDGACKAPEPECTEEGAKQCNSDNSNVQTCTDGNWVDDLPACNYGCEDGVCKEPPVEKECEEEDAVQCAEDTVQTCTDGKWTNADSACQYGCLNGACKPEPVCGDGEINGEEECDGTLLNDKTCGDVKPMSTGNLACDPVTCKFVADDCILPEEGSECDPATFIESCDGSKVVFCDKGEVVNGSYDCSADPAYTCVVIDAKGTSYADCKSEADKCDTIDALSNACMIYEGRELATVNICMPADDGNNYTIMAEYEICQGDKPSCLNDTGVCGKLVEDQNDPCDESFDARCDEGEIAVSCDPKNKVVVAEQCDEGLKCVVDDKGVPSCLMACTQQDEVKNFCTAESFFGMLFYYSDEYTCSDIKGSLYYQPTGKYNACSHGCDSSTGDCIMISEQEGKECIADDYVANCETSDILLRCSSGKIAARSCSDYYRDSSYICAEGDCVQTCETVDEVTYECDDSLTSLGIPAESSKFVCTKSGDINVWVEDEDAFEECESMQCAANGQCKPAVPCDPDTFVPRCDGEEVVICNEGVEYSALNCSEYTGYSCKVIDLDESKKAAYCFSANDICTGSGEELQCTSDSDGDEYSSLIGCYSANDGKKYSYEVSYTECDSTCDTTTNECALYSLCPDYDSYCDEGKIAVCDSDYVYCGAACTEEGAASKTCENGMLTTNNCLSVSGSLYDIGSIETCALNCDESGKDCDDKGILAADAYKACDAGCTVTGGALCSDYCKTTYGEDNACALDGEGYITCGLSCEAGDADSVTCVTSGSSVYQVATVCSQLTDGSYMYLRDYDNYKVCSGTCTEGVGCDE